jgi:hypothetical protein
VVALTQTKLIAKLCFTLLVVTLGSHAVFSQTPQAPPAKSEAPPAKPDEMHQLWSSIIEPSLRPVVTTGPQGQNFGATMMVPLHAAFGLRDQQWIQDFADHYARLADNFTALPSEDLGRLEYLYVASEFMVLCRAGGRENLVPRTLPGLVYSDIWTLWTKKAAWAWGRPNFQGGVRERNVWKLQNRRAEKNYYRAIIDADLFLFAIAADVKAYIRDPAEVKAWSPTLDDMLLIAHQVFTQEVVRQPDGGWLFQPGVWADFPEYLYAGNPDIHPGMKPAPVRDIAMDSSHSLRFPLWLTSQMRAYSKGSEGYQYFEELREGLDKQFFNKVLVKPASNYPCYRLNNFMDGSNGVYRWNYASLGTGRGYGPYQNSAALVLGWWDFLGTDRIRAVYQDMAAEFPWPKQCIQAYLGPAPANGYAESSFDPNSPSMRIWHLLVMLAARI